METPRAGRDFEINRAQAAATSCRAARLVHQWDCWARRTGDVATHRIAPPWSANFRRSNRTVASLGTLNRVLERSLATVYFRRRSGPADHAKCLQKIARITSQAIRTHLVKNQVDKNRSNQARASAPRERRSTARRPVVGYICFIDIFSVTGPAAPMHSSR